MWWHVPCKLQREKKPFLRLLETEFCLKQTSAIVHIVTRQRFVPRPYRHEERHLLDFEKCFHCSLKAARQSGIKKKNYSPLVSLGNSKCSFGPTQIPFFHISLTQLHEWGMTGTLSEEQVTSATLWTTPAHPCPASPTLSNQPCPANCKCTSIPSHPHCSWPVLSHEKVRNALKHARGQISGVFLK